MKLSWMLALAGIAATVLEASAANAETTCSANAAIQQIERTMGSQIARAASQNAVRRIQSSLGPTLPAILRDEIVSSDTAAVTFGGVRQLSEGNGVQSCEMDFVVSNVVSIGSASSRSLEHREYVSEPNSSEGTDDESVAKRQCRSNYGTCQLTHGMLITLSPDSDYVTSLVARGHVSYEISQRLFGGGASNDLRADFDTADRGVDSVFNFDASRAFARTESAPGCYYVPETNTGEPIATPCPPTAVEGPETASTEPAHVEEHETTTTVSANAGPANTGIPFESQLFIAVLCVVIPIYLIPTFIAFGRKHAFRWIILLFNVAAGWTGIGWLGLLAFAIAPGAKQQDRGNP